MEEGLRSNQLWPQFLWVINDFTNTTSAETGTISFGFPAMEDKFNFIFELMQESSTHDYRYEFRMECKHCTTKHPMPEDFTLTVCLKDEFLQEYFLQSVDCKPRLFSHCKDVFPRVLWSLNKAKLEASPELLYRESDTLTIFCEMVPEKMCLRKPKQQVHEERFLQELWNFACRKSHIEDMEKSVLLPTVKPDVYLKCGEVFFPAHTSILSARSSVLKDMINNMSEDQNKTIIIEGMNNADLKEFLLYLYWEKCSNISPGVAKRLSEAADKYAVEGLKEKCESYMEGKAQRKR